MKYVNINRLVRAGRLVHMGNKKPMSYRLLGLVKSETGGIAQQIEKSGLL